MHPTDRIGVLFVCLGNICRSPLAEGVFLHKINARGVASRFRVDSAGTGGWHAGETPDPRAIAVAKKRGIVLPSRARQVTRDDFQRFHHLVAMDESNRETLIERGCPPERVRLLLEDDDSTRLIEVPDPYYGGPEGFETVFQLIDSGCEALLERLLRSEQT
ncbi:MAG: low molecular weight phosphotyrosine protein phosphatase [Phycisphaeraceae bacterium]|nr:low molecular weight phosphotyrosine protein phosphatase [Phycisphaerales bacterium]QOJ16635.1 MAG: low molecular weight phosphotyrosine protein phosphatase [Phycisphaeraceae bacterium]